MENQKYDDKLIREVISNAPCSILADLPEEKRREVERFVNKMDRM